jgi:hypothetical protein
MYVALFSAGGPCAGWQPPHAWALEAAAAAAFLIYDMKCKIVWIFVAMLFAGGAAVVWQPLQALPGMAVEAAAAALCRYLYILKTK